MVDDGKCIDTIGDHAALAPHGPIVRSDRRRGIQIVTGLKDRVAETDDCFGTRSLGWSLKVGCQLGLIAMAGTLVLIDGAAGEPVSQRGVPLWPHGLLASPWVHLAQGLALLGGGITVWHYRLLRRARQVSGVSGQLPLVTDQGLFRWLRHPMYAGDALMMVGFALLAPSLLTGSAAALGWIGVQRAARAEETRLLRRYDQVYTAWMGRTGRLLPRFRPSETAA